MFRVIYMSTPTDGLAPLEVEQFVEKAKLSNSKQDITAFLLRFDQNFLQVLEGAPRKISDLMDKIWKVSRITIQIGKA